MALSTSSFAVKFFVKQLALAKRFAPAKRLPPSTLVAIRYIPKIKAPTKGAFIFGAGDDELPVKKSVDNAF